MSNKEYWKVDEAVIAELHEHIEAIKKIAFKYQLPAIVNIQTQNEEDVYRMAGFTYSACMDGDRCAQDFWFVLSASAVVNIAHELEGDDIEPVKKTVITIQAAMDSIMQHYSGILSNFTHKSQKDDKNHDD